MVYKPGPQPQISSHSSRWCIRMLWSPNSHTTQSMSSSPSTGGSTSSVGGSTSSSSLVEMFRRTGTGTGTGTGMCSPLHPRTFLVHDLLGTGTAQLYSVCITCLGTAAVAMAATAGWTAGKVRSCPLHVSLNNMRIPAG